jgi:uncharacterized protein (DUF2147 family)
MKRFVLCAAALFLNMVFLCGFCFGADLAEGFWISVDDKSGKATAGWEIYADGDILYGKILSVAGHPQDVKAYKCKDSYRGFPLPGKVKDMPVVGTPWIFGLSKDKPGVWIGGQIIDPDNGSMYKCRISYHSENDTLEMRGEIGLGIGRSQFWRRCSREEASALR